MEERIGKYELRSEIGRGGFGRVYRAYDPTVDRFVAVKVLTAGADADLLTRFKNEAAAAGKLRHENIVIIHEYGEHKGTPYLVMEFLEGQDLQHAISNGTPLTLLQKMRIMAKVAAGLECAHQNGVIHRDIKPANIMLLRDGSVKIMDFGIARLLRNDATRLTQKGYLVGSVAYMSPEQLKDGDVDALCDIWAYGVIYYELLTGRAPFQGNDPASTMYKILHEEPRPVASLASGCPEALERIIHRALSKHRDSRYQLFEDLLFDTEPILIEFQQQEATALLTEARNLFAAHQREAALNLVRQVLELDPTNRPARQLREVIQQQLKRVTIRPRVESLVKSAEEKASTRDYVQAMDLLESARRLDPTDPEIPVLLERIRVSREQLERAAKLLQAAQENLDRKNLTSAQRFASEALRVDPSNVSARMLLEQVQRGVAIREEQQRRDDVVAKARSLLLIQAFDEAIALLNDLRSRHPGDPVLSELIQSAEQKKTEHDRKSRVAAGLAEAKTLLKETKLAEAVAKLEALSYDFPSEREITDLLAHARTEFARVQQTQAVDKIARKAWSLAREFRFEESIALVEGGLRQYPGESLLVRILDTVLDSKATYDRERAVVEVLKKCDALQLENRLSEALEVLDAALRDWSDDQALIDLRLKIARDLETQRTASVRREFIRNAEEASASRNFQRTIQICEEALIQFPADSEILHLLETAEKDRREEKIARYIAEQITIARQVEAGNDRQAALDLLQRTTADYPNRQELMQEVARLTAELRQDEIARAEEELRRAERARAEEERRCTEERVRAEQDQRRAAELAHAEEERRRNEERVRAEQDRRRAAELAHAEEERRRNQERARAEQDRRRASELAAAEKERRRAEERANASAPARMEETAEPSPAGPVRFTFPWKSRSHKLYLAAAALLVTIVSGWLLIHWKSPAVPVFSYAPDSLSFVHEAGAAAPALQTIQIAGQPPGAPLLVRATESWIRTPSGGSIPGNVEIGVQPDALAPGTHSGAVEIASDREPQQWKRVLVSLTIKARETVQPDPAPVKPVQTGGLFGGRPPVSAAKPVQTVKAGQGSSQDNRSGTRTPLTKPIPQGNDRPGPATQTAKSTPPARSSTSPEGTSGPQISSKTQGSAQIPAVQPGTDAQRTTGTTIGSSSGSGRTPTLIPKAQWGGKQLGRITWTGQLPPNGRIVLGTNGVKEGPGSARGDYLPGVVDIALVEVTPGELRVDASPTEIVVLNASRSNIQFIQIRWKVK